MLCHEFEKIAGDLIVERLMEAGKRESAFRHASECPPCALRLSAERTLEAGLQTLRSSVEEGDAPPHVKIALRAVFDLHAKIATAAPVDAAAPVAPVAPVAQVASILTFAPANSRNWALRWLAIAAVILITIAIGLWSRATSSNSKEDNISSRVRLQPLHTVTGTDNEDRKIENPVVRKPAERPARRHAATSSGMTDNNETVTEYIPLTYMADATAMESGMVLRVELPPSALVTMGLPAPVERTDSRVKADLIVGDDGVPRAVRFVGQGAARK
ncbi:MAG: hypothetical protein J2P21_20045 [Chloracidobacterium sp.]|nr:hypothetical protein [Chloracidobacterium sp.]